MMELLVLFKNVFSDGGDKMRKCFYPTPEPLSVYFSRRNCRYEGNHHNLIDKSFLVGFCFERLDAMSWKTVLILVSRRYDV